MKKQLFIALAAIFACGSVVAQSPDALLKKLEKSDASIADAKKSTAASTWIDRANTFVDVSKAYTSKFIQGFTMDQLTALVGKPLAESEVEFKGVKYKSLEYPDVMVYLNNENLIVFWESKKDLVETPLVKAYESLVKAKELSDKDFQGNGRGATTAARLQTQLQATGLAFYTMGKFKPAADDFYHSYLTGALCNKVDTMYLYYAGVASFEAGEYQKTVDYMEKLLPLNADQEGMVYFYLSEGYTKQGQVDKGISYLEKGFEKYPNSSAVLGTLINAYMTAKKDPNKIIEKIKDAQKLDPKNISLYVVESTIYSDLGDSENAYKALDKAIELDPKFYNAYYNYAIMKILQAQALREQADKIDVNDNLGYEKLTNQIIQIQTDAIEKLEKAHTLDPKNFDTIDLLKQLYFSRREKQGDRYDYFEKLFTEMSAAK